MLESTQHPDGGVAVDRVLMPGHTEPFWVEHDSSRLFATQFIAFPVAQAARLIDVDDPQVRKRIAALMSQIALTEFLPHATDDVIGALQKGAPE